MDGNEFIKRATVLVSRDWYKRNNVQADDLTHRANENVKVVWVTKVLRNNKAILIPSLSPGVPLYEVTYNGETDEFYVDVYLKDDNYKVEGARV